MQLSLSGGEQLVESAKLIFLPPNLSLLLSQQDSQLILLIEDSLWNKELSFNV